MSPTIGLPPPEPESCLVHSRASRFKGGTLVNEEVCDLESHERRICDPDGYRPDACPRCAHTVLHLHSYRERKPRCDAGLPAVIRIVQYLCASERCGAIWRVLPLFLARHLWWVWRAVECAVQPKDERRSADRSPVPLQTQRRWRARLASSARVLIALFAARADAEVQEVAVALGADATRAALVDACAVRTGAVEGEQLAGVATLAHRLERGVRLM
jgi:hypothetical protein